MKRAAHRRVAGRRDARNAELCAALSEMDITTAIGSAAAFCTTVSYYPQLRKCWLTGKTGDLSLTTFSTLATGVALWAVYGVLKADVVIIAANVISLCLLLGILFFKLRERSHQEEPSNGSSCPAGTQAEFHR